VGERTGSSVTDIQETILIRQGCYCGRKISGAGHSAIWFVEESQVKLQDPEGQLLGTMTIAAFLQMQPGTGLPKAA
jgi:hypothetical protein